MLMRQLRTLKNKGILFFNYKSIGTIFSTLFLIGCGYQPEPELKYIKSSCPEMIILKPIPKKYYTTPVKLKIINDGEYYKVPKKQLKQASLNSQKKSILIEKQQKYIKFYETQILKIKKFSN